MISNYVEKYIQLRDKKVEIAEKHKAELAPLNEAMEAIEKWLLTEMEKLGVESVKTPAGTPYKSITKTVKALDMEAFKGYVFSPDSAPKWDLVDFRPLKKGIMEYVEDKGTLPPGLTMDSFTSINIRRN
jgi:hypothetical protein